MSKDFVLHKQVKIKLYEQKHFKVIMITFSSLDINCHKKINIIISSVQIVSLKLNLTGH